MKASKLVVCLMAGASILAAGTASAELPAAATTAITTLQGDGTALISAGWPLATALAGGLALIGVFKKVLGKAV